MVESALVFYWVWESLNSNNLTPVLCTYDVTVKGTSDYVGLKLKARTSMKLGLLSKCCLVIFCRISFYYLVIQR